MNWLQNHLLPCPFKYITGIDCPGCGFQRALLALLKGDIQKSLILYPAALPILLFFAFTIAGKYLKLGAAKYLIKNTLVIFICAVISISYGIKILGLFKII